MRELFASLENRVERPGDFFRERLGRPLLPAWQSSSCVALQGVIVGRKWIVCLTKMGSHLGFHRVKHLESDGEMGYEPLGSRDAPVWIWRAAGVAEHAAIQVKTKGGSGFIFGLPQRMPDREMRLSSSCSQVKTSDRNNFSLKSTKPERETFAHNLFARR